MAIATYHLLSPHLRPGARVKPADIYPSLKPKPARPASSPAEIAALFSELAHGKTR